MSSFSTPGRESFGQPRRETLGQQGGAHAGYSDEQLRVLERLQRLAYLLDARFRVPGTDFRVGLDGLLGLLPGVGDAASFALSAYIVLECQKLKPSPMITLQMIGNIIVDALVGSIPILGDFFDVAFKANIRNLRLMGIEPRW